MEDLELELSGSLYLTQDGMDRLKKELQYLTVEKRREIAERIRESKDHGEFSEDNSELDEVKVEQAIVENRISDLKTILSGATILSSDDIPTDYVGLGSVVTVKDGENDIEFSVRIVASIEANPEDDFISEESPLGAALMGKKVGETATFDAPAGTIKYQVVSITR
jgi:transcription elongation factor GreA